MSGWPPTPSNGSCNNKAASFAATGSIGNRQRRYVCLRRIKALSQNSHGVFCKARWNARSRSMLAARSFARSHPIGAVRTAVVQRPAQNLQLRLLRCDDSDGPRRKLRTRGSGAHVPIAHRARRRSSPDKNKVPSKCSRFGASARQCRGFRAADCLTVSFHSLRIAKGLGALEGGEVQPAGVTCGTSSSSPQRAARTFGDCRGSSASVRTDQV